jgi:hypothetical protein
MRPRSSICVSIGVALIFVAVSCHRDDSRVRTPTVVWRKLGSWSGHGSVQTDPFICDTGSLRLRWETRNETTPGSGIFRVDLHSDVSGRVLLVAIDSRGVGHNTTYVNEDPRPFFLAIESANLDWTIEAEEGVDATRDTTRHTSPDVR